MATNVYWLRVVGFIPPLRGWAFSSLFCNPCPRFSAHVTAKSALNGLSRALATELGRHNIVANVVSPDFVRTDASAEYVDRFADQVVEATPLSKIADPEDVARGIAMFASQDAQFVTGSYTPVNGGIITE